MHESRFKLPTNSLSAVENYALLKDKAVSRQLGAWSPVTTHRMLGQFFLECTFVWLLGQPALNVQQALRIRVAAGLASPECAAAAAMLPASTAPKKKKKEGEVVGEPRQTLEKNMKIIRRLWVNQGKPSRRT